MIKSIIELFMNGGKKKNKIMPLKKANCKWEVCDRLDKLKAKLNGDDTDSEKIFPAETPEIQT